MSEAQPHPNRRRASLRTALRQRATLQQAYLLVEILSPPLSKRRPTVPAAANARGRRTEQTPS